MFKEIKLEHELFMSLHTVYNNKQLEGCRKIFHRNEIDTYCLCICIAESSSFMRKESVENLTRYWVEIRQVITQDYKKKRKDALRRQKKTSYRRIER